jgi:hypothetical protein
MLALLQNCTDPTSEQQALPPVKDYGSPSITIVGRAALLGYNLTNPDDFGARGHDRKYWPDLSPASRFKDKDDFFLLVNFEPNFLELSFVCVNWINDECPSAKAALLDVGENPLFNSDPPDDVPEILSCLAPELICPVSKLTRVVTSFVETKTSVGECDKLRIVTLVGGASPIAVDAMRIALDLSLPFWNPGGSKRISTRSLFLALGALFGP